MKTRMVTIDAFVFGYMILASGCQHNRATSPSVRYPSGGSNNAQETYTPSNSGGSGTRSAPVSQGSGSR